MLSHGLAQGRVGNSFSSILGLWFKTKPESGNIVKPEVFVGWLLGAMLVFLFSAFYDLYTAS